MKFLLATLFIAGLAHSQSSVENLENIEVGSPKDCVALGKTDDQQREDDRHDLQQKIMNCLGPQEDEKSENRERKNNEVVSQ